MAKIGVGARIIDVIWWTLFMGTFVWLIFQLNFSLFGLLFFGIWFLLTIWIMLIYIVDQRQSILEGRGMNIGDDIVSLSFLAWFIFLLSYLFLFNDVEQIIDTPGNIIEVMGVVALSSGIFTLVVAFSPKRIKESLMIRLTVALILSFLIYQISYLVIGLVPFWTIETQVGYFTPVWLAFIWQN